MALVKCPDCGKEHSDSAPACPNCGRPGKPAAPVQVVEKKKSIGCAGAGCLTLVVIFMIFYVTGAIDRSNKESLGGAASVAGPPAATGPQLELQSWHWGEEYSHAIAEGTVKNISGENLRNVTAVVTFMSKDGSFITSSDALVDYNPILPGQTSPFKVITTHNPAMRRARVEFKELMGGTIAYRDKKKSALKTTKPGPSPGDF